MVDMLLKWFGATAVFFALTGEIPVEQALLALVVAWAWISRMNVWGGAPVYS